MITLLVAFFIMMYSMSVMNMKKFQQVAIAIRSGFGGKTTGEQGVIDKSRSFLGTPQEVAPQKQKTEKESFSGTGTEEWPQKLKSELSIFNYVKNQLAVLKLDETVQPILDMEVNEGNRFTVMISDQIVFAPEEATLPEDGTQRVLHIADILKDSSFNIIVEGYASRLKENSAFSDSWELSLARTRHVAGLLVKDGKINPRRISLTGYGEWKPPGKAKKLALNGYGEWKPIDSNGALDDIADRIVLSIIIQ
jgi:chemotaxis protein MotB